MLDHVKSGLNHVKSYISAILLFFGRFMQWKPQCEPHRQPHRQPQREQHARGSGDGGAEKRWESWAAGRFPWFP